MIKITFEMRDGVKTMEEVAEMVRRSEIWTHCREWSVVRTESKPPPQPGEGGRGAYWGGAR